MGAPLAYSPGGSLIYHGSSHALATKKDRVEDPPEEPTPGTGNRWYWRGHSFSIQGHNTEMFAAIFDRYVTVGDKLYNEIEGRSNISYFTRDIPFETYDDKEAYISTYEIPQVTLRVSGHITNLPDHFTGDGVIQFQVTVSSASSYPTPYWTWNFYANTHGQEFIIIPISAYAQNGQHPMMITGWAAYYRYRY